MIIYCAQRRDDDDEAKIRATAKEHVGPESFQAASEVFTKNYTTPVSQQRSASQQCRSQPTQTLGKTAPSPPIAVLGLYGYMRHYTTTFECVNLVSNQFPPSCIASHSGRCCGDRSSVRQRSAASHNWMLKKCWPFGAWIPLAGSRWLFELNSWIMHFRYIAIPLWHPTYLLLEVMLLGQFHREKSHCPWKIQRRNPFFLDPSQRCFPSRNVNWKPRTAAERPTHGAWTDASLAWIPPSSRSRRIRFLVPIGFAVMTTKTLETP